MSGGGWAWHRESEDTTEGAWLEDTQEDLGTGQVAGAVPRPGGNGARQREAGGAGV